MLTLTHNTLDDFIVGLFWGWDDFSTVWDHFLWWFRMVGDFGPDSNCNLRR